jgi:hypothetical protein
MRKWVFTINESIITYGEGWVSKKIGNQESKIFYAIEGMTVDDEFVQEWIRRTY